jgi:hypothetical protein
VRGELGVRDPDHAPEDISFAGFVEFAGHEQEQREGLGPGQIGVLSL